MDRVNDRDRGGVIHINTKQEKEKNMIFEEWDEIRRGEGLKIGFL